MSNAATPTTRLTSTFLSSTAATIRLTYDPTGVPQTVDFVVGATAFYVSHDDFLTSWEATIEAALGGNWTLDVVPHANDGTCRTRITTLGLNYSVNWSFAGDGTAVRNWLGETGNVTNRASGALFSAAQGGAWAPERPAQVMARNGTSRPRSQLTTLSGAGRTQHNSSPSDTDDIGLDVELWFGPTAAHAAQGNFETQFLDGLDTYASDGQFTLLHGTENWLVAWADEVLRLACERVSGEWDDLWRIRFPVRQVSGR